MNAESTNNYQTEGFFDEMFKQGGEVRPEYRAFNEQLEKMGVKRANTLQHSTERAQLTMGMTFNVYSDNEGIERILPLDIIPRIISNSEWQHIAKGLEQRIYALNLFIHDVYNGAKILKDKVLPKEMVLSSSSYLKQCLGMKPAGDIWSHITGTDLIRGGDGTYRVLEDNLRCPSGVSYLLENREILKRIYPEVFEKLNVRPVYHYTHHLYNMLESLAPTNGTGTVAVLTPGIYNSAYFEHSYLAQQMGVELVEGSDLVVKDGYVYMLTTAGLQKVDVIYRRIDDEFLDPKTFNPDSMLGTPGIFEAFKKGNVVLANAPGTGFADDKAVYSYVPRIIKYYTGEDPIIPNVDTYICDEEDDCKYVLENIEKLVVKQTDASGGYGMLIGPAGTKAEHELFRQKIKANPRNYIAQPVIDLSRVPTLIDGMLEGRHVDLRPYVLYGKNGIEIVPGGLTRVALKKGSLVVNSSQGGGSKDTWVLND